MLSLKERFLNIVAQTKKHLFSTAKLIIAMECEAVNHISDGIKEKRPTKVIVHSSLFLSLGVLSVLVALLIVKIIIRSRYILGAVALFILATYSIKSEEPKPTEKDYQDVLDTIRPSVAAVALPLNLAPIDRHVNMEVDPKNCIQQWKGGWRMVYKALKRSTDPIDIALYQRTIQKAIEMTLNQSNPAGFPEVQLKYGNKSFPIIIVDEVKDEDTYIYIFAVICTRKYLKQKFDPENNAEPLPKADTDDEDF